MRVAMSRRDVPADFLEVRERSVNKKLMFHSPIRILYFFISILLLANNRAVKSLENDIAGGATDNIELKIKPSYIKKPKLA